MNDAGEKTPHGGVDTRVTLSLKSHDTVLFQIDMEEEGNPTSYKLAGIADAVATATRESKVRWNVQDGTVCQRCGPPDAQFVLTSTRCRIVWRPGGHDSEGNAVVFRTIETRNGDVCVPIAFCTPRTPL